VFHTQRLT